VRLALLSDQHGNDVAFAAALADVERIGVDRVVCLGDVAQGGAQPAETLDRLKMLGAATVLGNADAFLLEVPSDSPEPVTDRMLEIREWTLSRLGPSYVDQLRAFRDVIDLELDGHRIRCFHGSPRSFDDVLIPEREGASLEPFLADDSIELLAGGHTHKQWTRRIGEALFVNPGRSALRTTIISPTRTSSSRRMPSTRSSSQTLSVSPSSSAVSRTRSLLSGRPSRQAAGRPETSSWPSGGPPATWPARPCPGARHG